MTWDPHAYLKFADHRLRPALDLLARIPIERPRTIYDLGCGPGNITRLLAERWPNATVTGIDSSAEMLFRANKEAPNISFVNADISEWSAPVPANLLFSNATMHWLDDHRRLLPRLISQLAPAGVLAVQMPCDRNAPCNLLIEETALDGPWHSQLSKVRPVFKSVETAEVYYQILAPLTRQVDIWESVYIHVLEGANPVLEWNKGTALRPYLDLLNESECEAFLEAYASQICLAYPKQSDGRTLLPYRRIFLIAEV